MIRSIYAAWSRRDAEGALVGADADTVADWSRSIGPMQGTYRGREELRAMWESSWEVWTENRLEPLRIHPNGDELLVEVRTHGRGRDGIELEARAVHAWCILEGRVIYVRLFQTLDDALAHASTK